MHGDAKLPNFCFHKTNDSFAAVDFQYMGNGSPVKGVNYFIGVFLFDTQIEKYRNELFDFYLKELTKALSLKYSIKGN